MGSLVYLNYLYFAILTTLSLLFIYGKSLIIQSPINNQKIRFDGDESFWILLFATSLFALNVPGILDLMAIRLLVLELLCILCISISKKGVLWTTAALLYIIYIGWLIIGLLYSPAPDYGVRVLLKYIYPIIIILTASAIVRDNETAYFSTLYVRGVALVVLIISIFPIRSIFFPGVFWTGTAEAIHFISMCILSLAVFYHAGKDWKDLLIAGLFIIPCIIWVFRTSIMGTALAIMFFFLFRYRMKSIPFIFIILGLFIASIFFIPSIKEKMFYQQGDKTLQSLQEGKISKDDIDSNGRFAMWDWAMERYYNKDKWIGTGTGNLQQIFYETKHPFQPIKICHNDYVQILCDNGLIGLFLFGGSFIALIIHCFIVYQRKENSAMIRICAITAGSSMAGMLLTMYTDNTINYTMATLSMPCGFYGMMLGLLQNKKTRRAV